MFKQFKRLVFKAWLLTSLISLLTVTVALAAPGDVDTTFGEGGVALIDFGGQFDRIYDIAIQPDGKIVAVGFTSGPNGRDFLVTRTDPDGTPDNTFSGDGKLRVDFGGNDTAWSVELQGNKIIVAGSTCNASSVCNVAMSRHKASGGPDSTFGQGGKVVTDFGAVDNMAIAIALQTIHGQKKIVLVGNVFNGADYDFAIYRYDSSGSLDASFGKRGKVRLGFGTGRVDHASGVDIQDSDQKIVVVGSSSSSANGNDFAIARLMPTGTLDPSFGVKGKQLTSFGADDLAFSFAGQPDGKIVVVGQKIDFQQTMSRFAVARYRTDGTLDPGFGVGGKREFTIFPGQWSYAYDLFISSGKIVVVGATEIAGSNIFDFAVVRLDSRGRLDGSFGVAGKVNIDFGGHDLAYALARQPSDGKYILGGSSSVGIGGADVALTRVLP